TYTTPALHVEVSGMLTNTHCTSPYRGAGRPEASYMIERLIDLAADQMDVDPAELRRRNTIPPQAMPYKTPLTFTYDSGRFEENLDRTMKLANWAGFAPRRQEAARRGMLRGIGISNTIEQAADPTYETAEVRFDPLGGLTLVTGSISHGQGHATVLTQILVDRLGVDPQRVNIIQGDTDAVAFGMGTVGSRSTTMSGGALTMVSDKIVAKGRKLAAHMMEASDGDIEFKDGRFTIAGTDRAMGIHEMAKAAFQLDKLPAGMEPGLYETATYRARSSNFPNGCHVCEVEIDPETGSTQLIGYWVVDDVGTVINPMLVKDQIMGGIAQGLGQVLMEDKSYDETGQAAGNRGQSSADGDQSARCERRRRSWHRRLSVRRRQRHRRRTVGAWHQAHRHAVHALPSVAGAPERWDVRHEAEDFPLFAHSTACDLEPFHPF